VVTGAVIQGENSSYIQAFPAEVAKAFDELIGLAEHSLDVVKTSSAGAVEGVLKGSESALKVASERTTISENPTAALANKFIPALTVAAVAVAAVMIFRTLK
jgi:hypothetical protein